MEILVLTTGEIRVLFSEGEEGKFQKVKALKDEIVHQLWMNRPDHLPINPDAYYILYNGRRLEDDQDIPGAVDDYKVSIYLLPRVLGGKGGFGSMLRAIGAQIEKTTNRDACRDLSGRRLRDLNEEQRLKKYFSEQEERDRERHEAKRRKLDKLKQVTEGPALPKIEDQAYLQKREDIADNVFDAVDDGFIHSSEGSSLAGSSQSQGSLSEFVVEEKIETESSQTGSSAPETSACPSSASTPDTTPNKMSPDTSPNIITPDTSPSKKGVKRTLFDEDVLDESDLESDGNEAEAEASSSDSRSSSPTPAIS